MQELWFVFMKIKQKCCFHFLVNVAYVNIVMPVCMASYVTTGYGHANHAFRVNVCF
jgi:hypothetical protein